MFGNNMPYSKRLSLDRIFSKKFSLEFMSRMNHCATWSF